MIYGVTSGLIILYEFYRVIAGKVSEDELVMTKASEEQGELEELEKELAEQKRLEQERRANAARKPA